MKANSNMKPARTHLTALLLIPLAVLNAAETPTRAKVLPEDRDHMLFDALDLGREELCDVKAALDRSDMVRAKAALVAHFRARAKPVGHFLQRIRAQLPVEVPADEASDRPTLLARSRESSDARRLERGSGRTEGLRACTSLIQRAQFPELEERLKQFHADHPVA